jgi:hypothetical protein
MVLEASMAIRKKQNKRSEPLRRIRPFSRHERRLQNDGGFMWYLENGLMIFNLGHRAKI